MALKRRRPAPFTCMKMLFTRNHEPWTKETLGTAIYFLKIILSLIFGLVVGFMRISGYIGNIAYIICVAIQGLVTMVLKIDAEDILGTPSAPATEGIMQSYAIFLLAWIFVNTLYYQA